MLSIERISRREDDMKKKHITIVLSIAFAVVLLTALQSTALAEDALIKVTIDGKLLNTDVAPFSVNDRVLVPFRAIFEALGATVDYDSASKTAVGCKGLTYIFIQTDNKNAIILLKKPEFKEEISSANLEEAVESSQTIVLDVAATGKDGRIMVPARFIAESLGAKVEWDGKTRTVHITTLSGNDTAADDIQITDKSAGLSINSKIAGKWEFHFNQQSTITTITTPAVAASIHMKLTINENGTFQSQMDTTGMTSYGVTTMTGKYKIEGDKFVIYDGKKSFVPNKYIGGSGYEDKAVNNLQYNFFYDEEKDILVWNDWSFIRSTEE